MDQTIATPAEPLARAREHWSRGQSVADGPPALFSVAIGRDAGAGGTETARHVGRLLDWPVYDQEFLTRLAAEDALRRELLESIAADRHTWWKEETARHQADLHLAADGFAGHVVEVLFALAVHGHCVLVGRGASILLPRPSTLRVRVIAPLEMRISRLARKLHVGEDQARIIVGETDGQRAAFVQTSFQQDVAENDHYDLLVNTTRFLPADCARIIAAALRQLEPV